MNNPHKSYEELTEELLDAKSKIIVNGQYVHYKNPDKPYVVTGLGFLESNDEICVMYRALHEDQITFIRPLHIWLENVEFEGKTVPRFSKIEQS